MVISITGLVVDYSWIIYDVTICPNGEPQEEWVALTEKYSDRIYLGSDLVTSSSAWVQSCSGTTFFSIN